jgi:hypothetical protein
LPPASTPVLKLRSPPPVRAEDRHKIESLLECIQQVRYGDVETLILAWIDGEGRFEIRWDACNPDETDRLLAEIDCAMAGIVYG